MPKIGYGMIHLHKMELQKAAKYFQEILEAEPENETAKTFLGLVYSLNTDNRAKSRDLLNETSASEDPFIKKLSSTALEFVDKHTNKTETPFQALSSMPKGPKKKAGRK